MTTSYDKHKSQVEAARKQDGKFGSYEAGESGATLSGTVATSTLSFEEAREKFEDTFSQDGYAEVTRYHAVDSTGEVTRSGKQLKKPRVIKGYHSGAFSGQMSISDETRSGGGVGFALESVRTPLLERDGSVTENEDGSFTIERSRTGEKWDVRPIDWEETDKKVVGNPLEVTPEREQTRKRIFDHHRDDYKKAISGEGAPLSGTGDEAIKTERDLMVRQAMSTATTEGGRKYVEESLDDLDVEGRWQIKEALEKMDDPRYAQRRANVAAAAAEGYGEDSVGVPERAIESKLKPGQSIRYKAVDEGPDAPWREATVDINEHGELGYGSELRAAMLTGAATRGKSFHRDANGHYIQSSNAGWDGAATVFDFGEDD